MKALSVCLPVLVAACGVAMLGWETEGFRVVTTEAARRLAVERAPAPVPDVRLVDQDGASFSLRDYSGKTVVVEFIVTRCVRVCGLLGDDFRNVLALAYRSNTKHIALLSIAFDLRRDDREARARYADRYGATSPRWRIASPTSIGDLERLQRSFGVVIVPDAAGGFIHGDDIYVVDARGRLTRILDADTPAERITTAAAIAT